MVDEHSNQADDVRRRLEVALDGHGYGFQYAVLHEVSKQFALEGALWKLVGAELPVQVNGADTRIDFVLKYAAASLYLIAECKRANPSLRDWCFIRTPTDAKTLGDKIAVVEELVRMDKHDAYARAVRRPIAKNECSLAIEVKGLAKGDASGDGRGEIERATAQVLRGMNGFVRYVVQNPSLLGESQVTHFMPVVFTTARLWRSRADLSLSDLKTGRIQLDGSAFEQVKWLSYHYNQGVALRHDASAKAPPLATFLETHERYFVRTVFVVNAEGIEDFLTALES